MSGKQEFAWNSLCSNSYSKDLMKWIASEVNPLVCNSIKAVYNAFKSLKLKTSVKAPLLQFKSTFSLLFAKRSYTIKEAALSLYTFSDRVVIPIERVITLGLSLSEVIISFKRKDKINSFNRGFIFTESVCN
ncbi:hypothetical protein H0X06_06005 [Candidatus Dependentiae bacterium]|nr:hypothetical protein [Candidatus Dependentiae bacterium]